MVKQAVGEFLEEETREGLIFRAYEVNKEPDNRAKMQTR